MDRVRVGCVAMDEPYSHSLSGTAPARLPRYSVEVEISKEHSEKRKCGGCGESLKHWRMSAYGLSLNEENKLTAHMDLEAMCPLCWQINKIRLERIL